ncbi:MAG TPA: glycerate kinase [Candidatus Dormibacteraeota bacterium]|nr:glycerate kinase [Candidatus Dormibacteraeota bacterium]
MRRLPGALVTGTGVGGEGVGLAIRRVVCAPNAFKGSLGALEAAAAMAEGVAWAGLGGVGAVQVPVADGGDGTLDVLLRASPGSRVERVVVHGPLGAPVEARLGWLGDGSAVVELAEAAGLRLVAGGALDAMEASTFGVGELIRAALDGGAPRIVVGVGGSASTDGGAGLAVALGARLVDGGGDVLPPGGGALSRLASVDLGRLDARVRSCRIEVAVDVRSPLLGPRGAAAVFGPQKGATAAQVVELERGLACWASALGPVPADQPGMGAAGGAAYGFVAVCGATLLPGAALVCDLVGLDAAFDGAVLVLTGEGCLDSSTAEGKAPAEVAGRAAAAGLPCVALAGSVEQPVAEIYAEAIAIGEGLSLDESRARAAELLRRAARDVVRQRLGGSAARAPW